MDRYFAEWALEEEKMRLIQDFLPEGRYGKSRQCRQEMARIGEYGPYQDLGNGCYGACVRILDTLGPIAGELYGGGFLGMYFGNGAGEGPIASVEYCGDHLLGDVLEAVWGLENVLQKGLKFPESMETIMRACGEQYDKKAVHKYVLKMNKAVSHWGHRSWDDWVFVAGIASKMNCHRSTDFGKLEVDPVAVMGSSAQRK